MRLITLHQLKQYIGNTGTTSDPVLDLILQGISQEILDKLQRPQLLSATFTWKFLGNGKSRITLPYYPISAISALSIDGVAQTMSRVTFSEREVYYTLGQGLFPYGSQCVVSGTAGYAPTALPYSIMLAACELGALRYKEKDRIGEQSKAMGNGETVSYLRKAMPDSVVSALAPFINHVPYTL